MKIILDTLECEAVFYDALCELFGFDYWRGYGLRFDWNDGEYDAARAKLLAKAPDKEICCEDVLLEMLRLGHALTVVDEEGDGEYTRKITLQDIHQKVSGADPGRLYAIASGGDYDVADADHIMQCVFFDGVIFG